MSIALGETDLLLHASNAHQFSLVTAWIFRFKFNSLTRFKVAPGELPKERRHGSLSREEIDSAQEYWLRQEQEQYYEKEFKALRATESTGVDKASAIYRFDPFIDESGVMRLGGRLDGALLPCEQRHPALLPDISWLAKLLIRQAHERTLHGGARQMTAYPRQRFWITNLTRAIKTNNSRRIECTRQRQQMMGELPSDRVRPCRPFEHAGVDYAGPYLLKAYNGRCKIMEKKYVAVFVCMAS